MALSQLVYPEKKTQDVSTPVSRAGESAREPSSAQHAGARSSDTTGKAVKDEQVCCLLASQKSA